MLIELKLYNAFKLNYNMGDRLEAKVFIMHINFQAVIFPANLRTSFEGKALNHRKSTNKYIYYVEQNIMSKNTLKSHRKYETRYHRLQEVNFFLDHCSLLMHDHLEGAIRLLKKACNCLVFVSPIHHISSL